MKDMNSAPITVHVIGEYVPTLTGLEALREIQMWRVMFWKVVTEPNKVKIVFLMGQQGDPFFTQKYIRECIGNGDVAVLLNPTESTDSTILANRYRVKLKSVRQIVGQERLVLAMQDIRTKVMLLASTLCGPSIDYVPVTNYVDGEEVAEISEPSPEEVFRIVKDLLS